MTQQNLEELLKHVETMQSNVRCVYNCLLMYVDLDVEQKEIRKRWEELYLMPAIDRIRGTLKFPWEYNYKPEDND